MAPHERMTMRGSVTLAEAEAIVDAALAHAADQGEPGPFTIAVLDAGGHLVLLKRQDGTSFMKPDVAIGKAYGGLGMGRSSRALARRGEDGPLFVSALSMIAGGYLLPEPGGVRILDDGVAVGAVGVTGASSDMDEECGIVGINAVGLTADPAEPQPR